VTSRKETIVNGERIASQIKLPSCESAASRIEAELPTLDSSEGLERVWCVKSANGHARNCAYRPHLPRGCAFMQTPFIVFAHFNIAIVRSYRCPQRAVIERSLRCHAGHGRINTSE
jgi:hypothetical protein